MPKDDAISMVEPGRRDGGAPLSTEAAPDASPAATESALALLRRFHLGDPEAVKLVPPIGDDVYPALLNAYRYGQTIRFDYPLFLPPVDRITDGVLVRPLAEFLTESVARFAPAAEAARILKDNLAFVERHIRRSMEQSTQPMDAREQVQAAGVALQEQLELEDNYRQTLQQELDSLLATVPAGSRFLSYGPFVPLHLFEQAVEYFTHVERSQFKAEVAARVRRLEVLLDVEAEKTIEAGQPEVIRERVGRGSSFFDPKALSGVLTHKRKGSVVMPEQRRRRIEDMLARLRDCMGSFTPIRYVCQTGSPWDSDAHGFELIRDADPCGAANRLYQEQAASYAGIFASFRMAKLEIEDRYDPKVHDSWFASFDWGAFSAAELRLVPITVVLATCNHLATAGMQPLSRLLSSRRPVHVLAWVQAHTNPGNLDPRQTDYRTELAYLGIGHRQANVAQSSASRYQHLLGGYSKALANSRTSLHLINSEHTRGPVASTLNPWMMASAALEGRAHPFVHVTPGGPGEPVENVDFSGNPSPESNWSVSDFEFKDEGGRVEKLRLPFTYVDYILLKPTRFDHFRLLPEGCASEDLVGVDDYLAAAEGDVDRLIPFVYGVDGAGRLRKLVVSRRLMLECRDRLSYWQTLQAIAGVRNHYVDRVREQVTAEQRALHEREKAALIESHRQELEAAEREAATRVLGRLAEVLVGLDPLQLSAASAAPAAARVEAPPPAPAPGPEAAPAPAAPAAPAAETISFDEPYIDSIMCTSCDDCINLNKLMFAYNENKQAIIANARAGTFAQLVKAAEACPARCIHPGKPLNPDEAGLAELIQRAEAYN